jgi:hypothetical protein
VGGGVVATRELLGEGVASIAGLLLGVPFGERDPVGMEGHREGRCLRADEVLVVRGTLSKPVIHVERRHGRA